MSNVSTTDKILALIAHLGFFSGVGYVLAPLAIWLLKKDSEFVAAHAKQALVWQGGTLIAGTVAGIAGAVFSMVTAGLGAFLVVPAFMIAGLVLLIPSLIASVKVFNEQTYEYPVFGGFANKL